VTRLRELARRPSQAADRRERCDLCAEALADAHRHLLDTSADAVLCACAACAVLFDRQEAGGRTYRLLPRRRTLLDGHAIDDLLWASLAVPVGLAFFVRTAESGEVTVGYPSPLGTTRSTVAPRVWEEVVRGRPELAGLAEDVEALLVRRAQGTHEHWIVPLDDCYRLVAVVRTHWKGLAGGPEVWAHVDRFFAELGRPARDQGNL
jgi:hypothetical protein